MKGGSVFQNKHILDHTSLSPYCVFYIVIKQPCLKRKAYSLLRFLLIAWKKPERNLNGKLSTNQTKQIQNQRDYITPHDSIPNKRCHLYL